MPGPAAATPARYRSVRIPHAVGGAVYVTQAGKPPDVAVDARGFALVPRDGGRADRYHLVKSIEAGVDDTGQPCFVVTHVVPDPETGAPTDSRELVYGALLQTPE